MEFTINERKAKDLRVGDEVLILDVSRSICQNKCYAETYLIEEINVSYKRCGQTTYEFVNAGSGEHRLMTTDDPNQLYRTVSERNAGKPIILKELSA